MSASCARLEDSPHEKLGRAAPDVESAAFAGAMELEVGAGWEDGNSVETLVNGGEYFPRMLAAVRSAEKTITFESFVVVNAKVTYDIVMAMCYRAKAGVKVHVMLDGVGSKKLDERYLIALRHYGVEVELYRPYNFRNYLRPWHGNNRDHRKLLVVDGEVAFTGGAGYADCWAGDADESWRWRDTMYEVRGPIVASMQRGFADNWKEVTGVELAGSGYYPTLKKAGDMKVLPVLGAPWEKGDTLGASYLLAIDSAKKSLRIEHAYFLPNTKLREAILRACKRGVKVQIILPNAQLDSAVVRLTSKWHWPELQEGGVEIYEYQPCMLHGKMMVVDGDLAFIGSGNFDDRTFFINDEFNLVVQDRAFAQTQVEMFRRDLARSRRMTEADTKMTLKERLKQTGGRLIECQL